MPIKLKGSSSGDITLDVPATAGTNTLTLPAVTDTLTGIAATQTLTNKTLTSPVISGPSISGDLNYTGTLTGGTGIINIGSGQVYKDASGNVGIGTASPGTKLTVLTGAAGNLAYFTDNINADFYIKTSSLLTTIGPNAGSTSMAFQTSGAEKMRIDSSGNLGLGVTPSAWIGNRRVLAIGGLAVANVNYAASIGENAYNMYYTSGGTPTYQVTAPAAIYDFNNSASGGFAWKIAASGTAGNAITFTEAMRIDSSGNLLFNSGYGSVATAYGCRAWVNFNGTGTVAIRASGNVTSITDNAVGDYTVNFTTALVDANYAVCGTASGTSFNGFIGIYPGVNPASGSVRVATQIYNNSLVDQNNIGVAIFR